MELGYAEYAAREMQRLAATRTGDRLLLYTLADLYVEAGEPLRANALLQRTFRDIVRHGGANVEKYAFAFAIPCNTPGLKFICRESVDYGRSHFDHPLGSRFEEMDCTAVFDRVLVPWERVFMYGEQAYCAAFSAVRSAVSTSCFSL